jgi:uncharacterized Fe-S cluster-containing protein
MVLRCIKVSRRISRLLPGYGCGSCGFQDCKQFARVLVEKQVEISLCPFMLTDMFKEEKEAIEKLLRTGAEIEKTISILDNKECDFVLAPLKGEPSCREYILPLNSKQAITNGSYLKWRPLGCPITHFGEVFETSPLIGVYPKGPIIPKGKEALDIGIVMVLAFEGSIVHGKVPDVQETVIFMPEYCMMQKGHSGVIVEVVGQRVRIEGIQLTVWKK